MHAHHRFAHPRFARRAFLGSLLTAATALLVGARLPSSRATAARVGVLRAEDIDDGMLERGTRLGMEEALHTAGLLRRPLHFAPLDAESMAVGEAAAAAALREAEVSVVIAAVSTPALATLGVAAAQAGVIVLNVSARADELRERACDAPIFHVVASDRMRRAALEAWRSAGGTGGDAAALEWHPGLTRFGAEQLNDRCVDRFGAPMNDAAWLGWFGAKIAAETLFRAGSTALPAHLLDGRTRFDGHKGMPLHFRARDRQLVQPLYIVRGRGAGEVAAEVPDPRRATTAAFVSFGAPAGEACVTSAPEAVR